MGLWGRVHVNQTPISTLICLLNSSPKAYFVTRNARQSLTGGSLPIRTYVHLKTRFSDFSQIPLSRNGPKISPAVNIDMGTIRLTPVSAMHVSPKHRNHRKYLFSSHSRIAGETLIPTPAHRQFLSSQSEFLKTMYIM